MAKDDAAGKRDLEAKFDAEYQSTPPWDIGRPQPAFAALAAAGQLGARVLDLGCGTGEHTLMAAAAGSEAVGVDISPEAIHQAEAKAQERGAAARFAIADARHLETLGEQFDTVLDCGLFHVLGDEDRGPLSESLGRVMQSGGRYHILCFSRAEPGDWGPRRIAPEEIREAFAAGWDVESIEPADLHVTIRPNPVPGWHATIQRN